MMLIKLFAMIEVKNAKMEAFTMHLGETDASFELRSHLPIYAI